MFRVKAQALIDAVIAHSNCKVLTVIIDIQIAKWYRINLFEAYRLFMKWNRPLQVSKPVRVAM